MSTIIRIGKTEASYPAADVYSTDNAINGVVCHQVMSQSQ